MEQNTPNITLKDIAAAIQIIDLASARGAVKGEEMAAIGEIRTRLSTFLEHAQSTQVVSEDDPQDSVEYTETSGD